MKTIRRSTVLFLALLSFAAFGQDSLESIRRELELLKQRVSALESENARLKQQVDVERLIVRKELIVSDTGKPWEAGFEAMQIPRGIYARPATETPGGLWVRSRLIKGEIDDPFDDRFHALERDGTLRRTPGHISWNVWLGDAWRQMTLLQGEGVEFTEVPRSEWSGTTHPGQLRIQTFRPGHPEPLTDALIGQGRMSLGGGGYGGGGLPEARDVLQLWGGSLRMEPVRSPAAPRVEQDDARGRHEYALIAVGPQGQSSQASASVAARGYARLSWDSVPGADAYRVVRDGRILDGLIRVEGASKVWTDPAMAPKPK